MTPTQVTQPVSRRPAFPHLYASSLAAGLPSTPSPSCLGVHWGPLGLGSLCTQTQLWPSCRPHSASLPWFICPEATALVTAYSQPQEGRHPHMGLCRPPAQQTCSAFSRTAGAWAHPELNGLRSDLLTVLSPEEVRDPHWWFQPTHSALLPIMAFKCSHQPVGCALGPSLFYRRRN